MVSINDNQVGLMLSGMGSASGDVFRMVTTQTPMLLELLRRQLLPPDLSGVIMLPYFP